MKRSPTFHTLLILAATACLTWADGVSAQGAIRATTEDGRPVILNADGSWQFDTDAAQREGHRLALSVPRLQDIANGCRVSVHLNNLSADQPIGNFTPRIAFYRSDRITPMREIMRFRDVAPGSGSEQFVVLRYTACAVLKSLEINTLQDSCVIGGKIHEDFECLEWTRADPGALPISLPQS